MGDLIPESIRLLTQIADFLFQGLAIARSAGQIPAAEMQPNAVIEAICQGIFLSGPDGGRGTPLDFCVCHMGVEKSATIG